MCRSAARCAPRAPPRASARRCRRPRAPTPLTTAPRAAARPQVGTPALRSLDPFLMLDELKLPADQ